jgi:hypothetical protein
MSDIYECGICGCYHPWSWDGDCREDENRYGSAEDYAEERGLNPNDIEVFSWEDRLAVDAGEEVL